MVNKEKGILIICPFFRPNIGGVETHLDDLCEYLGNNNYQVYVITYQPLTNKIKGLSVERNGNIEIHRVTWIGYNLFHKFEPYPFLQVLYLAPMLFLRSFLFLLLNSSRIKVIHVHGLNAAIIGKILKKIFKKRLIVSLHAIYGWLYNLTPGALISKAIKWIFSSADEVLTLCEPSRRELVKIGIDPVKISVYTYWVNQNIFYPLDKEKCKKQLGWDNLFIVLFVGRFILAKGINILLGIIKEISDHIYFVFIGDGPLANEIYKAKCNNSKILYVGKINNKQLPIYYNAADLLCVPSQYDEGFGRVILEALSCGLPVVASACGAIPDAVGDAGLLVDKNKKDIMKAIEELFNNQTKLEELAEICKINAKKRFTVANAKIIEKAYGY